MTRHLWKLVFICMLGFSNLSLALEQDPHPFTSTADAERFYALTQEIRCVVCQNQNIADSNAPLANDLREKVYRMVIDKKSNADIKDYMVKRYGEFILLEPRINKLTAILWLFPLIGLMLAMLIFFRFMKKNQAQRLGSVTRP